MGDALEGLWVIIAIIVIGAIVVSAFNSASAKAAKQERDAKVDAFVAEITAERDKLMTGASGASLPVLDAADYGYRPVAKETLLGVQEGAERREYKSTGKYSTRGTSVSIPIVKGVRYRVGGGSVQTLKEWQTVGVGRLLVTDKAIAFESDTGNVRVTWTQVADIDVMWDGFQIHKRTGKPLLFRISGHDPKFAAVVLLLFSRAD